MIIQKEMGITHADFFRLLPRAMGNNPYEINDLEINSTLPTGTLKITLGPERERKMFLVVIPCTDVVFEYTDVDEIDRQAFIEYFELRFMRGLG